MIRKFTRKTLLFLIDVVNLMYRGSNVFNLTVLIKFVLRETVFQVSSSYFILLDLKSNSNFNHSAEIKQPNEEKNSTYSSKDFYILGF